MKETLIIAFGSLLTLFIFSSFVWLPLVVDILQERFVSKKWEKILTDDPILKDLVSNYIELRNRRHDLLEDLRSFRDSIDSILHELDYLPADIREQRLVLLETYRQGYHKAEVENDQLQPFIKEIKQQLLSYTRKRKIKIPENI